LREEGRRPNPTPEKIPKRSFIPNNRPGVRSREKTNPDVHAKISVTESMIGIHRFLLPIVAALEPRI
jgi:hypothetical protein